MNRSILGTTLVLPFLLPMVACHFTLGLGSPTKAPAQPPTQHTLVAGDPCGQSGDCTSGLCMGQHCCDLTNCGSDPTCKASSCDESGACQYPTGSCGSPLCDTSTYLFTQGTCVSGACQWSTPTPCPANLVCADERACLTQCTTSSECVGLTRCDGGSCAPVLADGSPCMANNSCFSGICGVSGSGHCCSSECSSTDTLGCAASDCDATGACVYPGAPTSCVSLGCAGNVLTEPAFCDGQGQCAIPSPAKVDCAPYLCSSPTQCGVSCTTDTECLPPGFCDTSGVCCAGYAGRILEVDGTSGVDQPCCGSAGGTGACATIAYSVQLAGKSPVANLTVHVANPPNGLDWVADTFPIQLSYGVAVNAPGLYFKDPGPNLGTFLFLISPFGSEPTTSAILEGTAAAPVNIGIDSKGGSSAAASAIQVDAPMTLNLLNAHIQNSDWFESTGLEIAGITVAGGATLALGTDGLGASGEVLIGSDANGSPGEPGIYCAGIDAQHLAVVTDRGSNAPRSVQFVDEVVGIDAEDYCRIDLSDHPLFGTTLRADGSCPFRVEWDGLDLLGRASVTLTDATFECLGVGVYAKAGTIAVANSKLWQNVLGIYAAYSSVDLSGGGNTIVCNRSSLALYNGAGITLTSAGAVDLEGTAWNHWDNAAGHTEIWTCDAAGSCTCSGASTCPSGTQTGFPDGADVVVMDTATTVDDANGQLGANACP